MKESESYLSLGSNLGDRMGYLSKSIDYISGLPGVTVTATSGIYETDPVGVLDQPSFLNLAMGIMTVLEPAELLVSLKEIERRVGRIRRDRWREREIDIDIIFYAGDSIATDALTIPHEMAHLRRFVLRPLSDIAPLFQHPLLHKTVVQLLEACPDTSGVRLFHELSPPVS